MKITCLHFSVEFALSQRGGRLLIFNGYSYSMQKFKNDNFYWRCTMVQPGTAKRCTAKLFTTLDYKVIDDVGGHCHKKPKFTKRNDTIVRIY
ncbi:unnamed protein product [Euphydryas editha]|uniref:FLYWCH-type domain-containing protein n=1 Tax=Euphydryas editha TaxID=104508 RepID=A0AAU9TM77_EUPED|nr:unnamed protein product [Euphydryas editha]